MPESIFDRKARVRPPRVHITYEVETGDAMEMRELPFVMGILSDLSGHPKEALPRLKDRKFVTVDRDNFDEVLSSMQPRLTFRVKNTLTEDGGELPVELQFSKLEDFGPAAVAQQIGPLKNLLDARSKLKDLMSRMEGNDRLEEILEEILGNAAVQEKVKGGLGESASEAAPAGEES